MSSCAFVSWHALRIALPVALAMLCALGAVRPATAQGIICNQGSSFHHNNATGPVEIAPAQDGQRIILCGFIVVQKGNTLDLHVLIGQGTNCDTNQRELFYLQFPNDVAFANRGSDIFQPGDFDYAMCIQTTGSNAQLGGILYWTQF